MMRRLLLAIIFAPVLAAIFFHDPASAQTSTRMMMGSAGRAATIAYASTAVDANALTEYTYAGQGIGTAAANRKVVVAAAIISSTSVVRTVSAMTIGGVSATLVKQVNAASGNYPSLEIWQAVVPTGTTGDIVVTWSGDAARCGIGVWAVYGAKSAAHDTGFSTASPLTDSLIIPSGGVGLGAAMSGGGATFLWENMTEQYDATIAAATTHSGADTDTAGTQTITATLSGGTEQLMALASWGPQ